jgi:soluble lytic murein transglycosylase-like protein
MRIGLLVVLVTWANLLPEAAGKIVRRIGPDGIPTYTYVPDAPRRPLRQLRATRRYQALLAEAARKFRLPVALLAAVLETESAGDAQAVSSAGAQGLMQLIPKTQARMEVADPFDPRESIFGGARYLRDLADRFDENLVLIVAGYHAGERTVVEAGYRIPAIPSTRRYVTTVLRRYYRAQADARRPSRPGGKAP